MKKGILLLLLFQTLIAGQAHAQHPNVLVSNRNQPEEPSIAIHSKNPAFIAAGANIRSAYYSSDTGHTWQVLQLTSSSGVWGDPALVALRRTVLAGQEPDPSRARGRFARSAIRAARAQRAAMRA